MTDLQHYNDAFRAFLDTLNDAQRRAVDLTEGPVLVIAGPVTAKPYHPHGAHRENIARYRRGRKTRFASRSPTPG